VSAGKYVSVGFSTGSGAHDDVDMYAFYVTSSGRAVCVDTYSTSEDEPPVDDSQDIDDCEGSIVDGWSRFTFTRKLRTGDSGDDVTISSGSMYMHYAYGGSASGTTPSRFSWNKHSSADKERINFLSDAEPPTTTTKAGVATTQAVGATTATMAGATTMMTTAAAATPAPTSSTAAEIARLEAELAVVEARIVADTRTRDALKARLIALRGGVVEDDNADEIEDLEEKLEDLEDSLSELENDKSDKEDSIDDRKDECRDLARGSAARIACEQSVEDLESELDEIEDDIDDKKDEIESVEDELNDLRGGEDDEDDTDEDDTDEDDDTDTD
jgi:prefoldin subunit 5